jgi:hypothetical protein
MREYHYRVDREGRIFHDGSEITDPPTLRFFLLGMTRTADGRYLVPCQGEQNWFSAEDTPFVVQRLGLRFDAGRLAGIDVCLAGDYREPLDPATLESIGEGLGCRVRRGAFRATFGRVAMQQIAPHIGEDSGRPVLVVGDRRYPIVDGSPVG